MLAILIACGRNNDNDETYYVTNEAHHEYVPDIVYNGGPQTLTLTMASPDHFAPFIQQAASMLHGRIYRETGSTFNLELTTYTWQTRESHMQRFRTMMMAGEAYDLFVVDNHPIRAFADNGLIIDINDLINQDPTVSRGDFFTNVLEAYEYQGQLLSIPLKFGFTYVGINSTLPQDIVDRFLQYETISYDSLLSLYHDLRRLHHGEFDYLNFSPQFTFSGLLEYHNLFEFAINDYIDFATRTASLTDTRFIDFLELYRLATRRSLDNPSAFNNSLMAVVRQRTYTEERANYFVFNTTFDRLIPWEALFELDSPPFINYIPVTDSRGRLLILDGSYHCVSQHIAVSAGADKTLAWELIKNLITVVSCIEIRHAIPPMPRYRIGPFSLKASIEINQFRERAERAFEQVFRYASELGYELSPYIGQDEDGARQQQITNAIARLERYNSMPVARRHYLPDSIWPIFEDFLDGVLTPEDTAHRLQNIISLWLIE